MAPLHVNSESVLNVISTESPQRVVRTVHKLWVRAFAVLSFDLVVVLLLTLSSKNSVHYDCQ